jgi:hypothetical protein
MNELTGSDMYSAGFHDNWVKRASIGIDRLLEKTQLPQLGEAAGRAIGEPLGLGDIGAETGRGLPRMAVNLAPLALGGFGGVIGRVAGTALTAGLAGAETYTATDSPLAGAIAGTTFAATPLIGRLGQQIALRTAGAKLLEEPILGATGKTLLERGYYGQTGLQKLAGVAGEQAGVVGALAAGHTGTELATGQPLTSPISPESLLSLSLSALPFAAAGLATKGISRVTKGPGMTSEQIGNLIDIANQQVAMRDSAKKMETEPGNTKIPNVEGATAAQPPSPETIAKTQRILAELRGEQIAIKDDPNLTDEQKIQEVNNRTEREAKLMQGLVSPPGSVFGNAMMTDDPRQEVIGSQVMVNKAGTHRWVYVNNDEANPEELRGRVIGFSTKNEPPPRFGLQSEPSHPFGGTAKFSLPEPQWWSVNKTAEEWNTRYKKTWFPAGERGFTGELAQVPTEQLLGAFPRQEEMTHEQLSANMRELSELHAATSAAETPADLQRAVVQLNGIEGENDLPQTNDNDIKPEMQRLVDEGVSPGDAAKTAVKVKITRAQQKLQARREAQIEPLVKVGYTREQIDAMTPTQLQAAMDATAELVGGRRKKAVTEEEVPPPTEEMVPTEVEEAVTTGAGRKAAKPSRQEEARLAAEGLHAVTSDHISMGRSEPEAQSQEQTDINTDAAIKAVGQPAVKAAFDAWPEKGDDRDFAHDAQDFLTLTENFGSLKNAQAHAEEAAKVLTESRGGAETFDRGDVIDLLSRPHVQEMGAAHDRVLTAMQTDNRAPTPTSQDVLSRALEHMLVRPAGNRFLFSMAKYDPATQRLGGRDIRSIGGVEGAVPEDQFTKFGGVGKPLNKNEVALYKSLVPEAFKEGKVDVPLLDRRLREVGPVLEVHQRAARDEYAPDPEYEAAYGELNRRAHDFETRFPGYRVSLGTLLQEDPSIPGTGGRRIYPHFTDEQKARYMALPQDLRDAHLQVAEAQRRVNDIEEQHQAEADFGGGDWREIGPKHGTEMPGYVEGLVRLPSRISPYQVARTEESRRERGVLYTGPHFGSEDQNVVAFYRGYEETLPNGEKAFHVIEVQSDWAQRQRDALQHLKTQADIRGEPLSDVSIKRLEEEAKGHPLLNVYNELALKAAIQHAKDIGATKLILSDAETAMMTEGHDQALPAIAPVQTGPHVAVPKERLDEVEKLIRDRFASGQRDIQNLVVSKVDGAVYAENQGRGEATKQLEKLAELTGLEFSPGTEPRPVQEKGMRLHYDQKLPSAMEKLTRDKGEVVDLGAHKNALESTDRESYTDRTRAEARAREIEQAEPGAHVEIREHGMGYDLYVGTVKGSPVFKDAEGNPKTNITGRAYDISQLPSEFTLTEPSRALGGPPRAEPFLPTEQRDFDAIDKMGLNRGGRGMLDFLKTMPQYQALARDLDKFGPLLDRITGRVMNIDGAATRWQSGDRFQLMFTPGLLRTTDALQAYYVAHELVHGLTKLELANPSKAGIVEDLDNLRQKLVDQLPSDMRQAYDAAVKSEWYDRYARGQVSADSIMPGGTVDQKDIVYGLLNNDELVAQGFGNHAMRNYMLGIKSDVGTMYHRFTGWVKSLLGIGEKVDGTAFHEFLSHSDRLLERGNFVANFRNYTDRYFGNLGISEQLIDPMTQRATGVLLGMEPGMSSSDVLETLWFGVGPMRTPEYQQANRDLARMFRANDEVSKSAQNILGELGHPQNGNGVVYLAHEMMLGNVPDSEAVLQTLPEQAVRYIRALVQDSKMVLGAVHSALDAGKGVVNIHEAGEIKAPLKNLLDSIEGMVKQDQAQQNAVADVMGFFGTVPDGAFQQFAQDPSRAPTWAAQEDRQKINWFWKMLGQTGQLARMLPEAAEVFSKGYQLATNTRKMMSEILRPLGTNLETMEVTHESVKSLDNALANPRVQRAVNRWIGLTQRSGQPVGKIEPISSDNVEVQKLLQGLSQKEQDQAAMLMQQRQVSNQAGQSEILEKGMQIASTEGASIVQKDMPGTKMKDAVGLSRAVLEAFAADRSNPAEAQAADAKLAKAQQQMTPDAFLSLIEYQKGQAEHWKLAQKWMQDNSDWATAQRYGKYIFEYVKGGKALKDGADSMKEAVAIAGGKQNIKSFVPNGADYEDRPPWLGPDAPGIIQRMRELEQNRRNIMMSKGLLTREGALEDEKYSAVGQLATEETFRGGIQGLAPPPRRLTKVSEDFPWMRNHLSWARKVSSYWSRRLLRAQVRTHLLDPEIAGNKELENLVRDHYDNLLKPDTQLGRFMQKFAMTWFLGFSPAAAIVNSTQPFLTHVAELTSMTGKPLKSYVTVLKSLGEVFKGTATGKWSSPDHEWAIRKSAEDGELDPRMFDDRAAYDEAIATNHKKILDRGRPQTLAQKLSTMAGNYSTVGMWMFRTVERINAQSAILSAFDHYRASEPNLSRDEALAKAYLFNHAVNYGGGAAQRPIGLYKGLPRTVAMLATSMQSYVLGTTGQLARYIQAGRFRPGGLKPSEVFAARKAAVQMLGTQLALAGTLGMPFVSSALALLDKTFPGLEVNKHLREWMAQLFGEDAESGHTLTDIAMTGVPSMMGWDLQSRLSMGNTLPGVSEVNGFEPERLLGAPFNLVANFIKGGQQALTGDPHAIDAFTPNGLKQIEKMVRSGGQVLDYRNRPIFKPTAGEMAGIALGFQPKRLSDFNAAQRITRQAQDNITSRENQFHQSNAEQVLSGNFGNVRNAVLQRAAEDKTYDVHNAVRSIARAAEELTFPRDLRSEGPLRGADARSRLLATFNLPQNQPSEMTRLQFRSQVERRLGLVQGQSSKDLQRAQLVDELRQRYPAASRAELNRQASLLLTGPRPQTLASPVE